MAASYDYVLEFRADVVGDLQTRLLNRSFLTDLVLTTPISRMVLQPIPPFQVKAQWREPRIALGSGELLLSVKVEGGARHLLTGTNLTLKGRISARGGPVPGVVTGGQPVVTMVPPGLSDLDMSDLDISYEGDENGLARLEVVLERAALTPVFQTLLRPLAQLPLTYLPASVTSLFALGATGSVEVGDARVRVDPQRQSLAVALAPALDPPGQADIPLHLAAGRTSINAALAMSGSGLNRALAWVLARDGCQGTNQGTAWRWDAAAVTLTASSTSVAGRLWYGSTPVEVGLAVRCSLAKGRLIAEPDGPAPGQAQLPVVLDAWASLLGKVFLSSDRPQATDDTAYQRFVVPGTDLTVDAAGVDLSIRDGYLVALYAASLDERAFTVEITEAEPQPRIIQSIVPQQSAPGAPVTADLSASVSGSAETPFDFAWRVENEPGLRSDHHATLSITRTPPPTATPPAGPVALASVTLRTIDMLGRAGTARFTATYQPAAAPQQSTPQQSTPKPPDKPAPKAAGVPAKAGWSGGFGTFVVILVLFIWHPWDTTPATTDVFTIPVTIGQETMNLRVVGGRVCQPRDTGIPYRNEFLVPGVRVRNLFTVTFTTAWTCTGSYVRTQSGPKYTGSFWYTETAVSDRADVSGGAAPGVCTASSFTYLSVRGSIHNHSVTATYSYSVPAWSCGRAMDVIQYALDRSATPVRDMLFHTSIL